jgi:tetratricopeptide (TPR) repeat protein
MPDDSIHRNISPQVQQEPHSEDETGDKKAEKLIKEADDADSRFLRSKSDADKKICIDKQLTAANYLMFEANLSPKKKYRPALKRYRRVLELDPGNKEALENKTQIEEIYRSMGMPVPD